MVRIHGKTVIWYCEINYIFNFIKFWLNKITFMTGRIPQKVESVLMYSHAYKLHTTSPKYEWNTKCIFVEFFFYFRFIFMEMRVVLFECTHCFCCILLLFCVFFLEWYICIYVAMHTRTTFRFLILFFGFFICVLLTNLIQIFRWIHMQPGWKISF